MKLISMTDFVLEQYENWKSDDVDSHCSANYIRKTSNYAKFLKQPLELWMFVPCKLVDSVWVVLEEPSIKASKDEWVYQAIRKEYQQAKERCLFEELELSYTDGFVKTVSKGREIGSLKINFKSKNVFIHRDRIMVETIEDLVKYNLQLTPTAQKQIGL